MSTTTTTTSTRKNGKGVSNRRMERVKGHVQRATRTAVEVVHKVAERMPESSKQGFNDGREAGRQLVNDLPYLVGASAGFGFGVTEAVVGIVSMPARALFGMGVGFGTWAARTLGQGRRPEDVKAARVEMA